VRDRRERRELGAIRRPRARLPAMQGSPAVPVERG